MNTTIQTQLNHKTIREFKPEPVAAALLDQLYQVAMRTATSSGMQAASIIRVTDAQLKQQLARVCKQEYVARLPEFWLFIVDAYRNSNIAAELNCAEQTSSSARVFFQAYADAVLMAKNVEVAAESLGLGTVFFGSIHNDPAQMIELFALPKLTFPVLGFGFGYPNQQPQLKPRMPHRLRLFENSYQQFDSYLTELAEYDQAMRSYYDLRDFNKRTDSFSNMVIKYLTSLPQFTIVEAIRQQGFDI